MLRELIGFQGTLKRYSSKYKADLNDVITEFTIQHIDKHDSQSFLDTYASKCNVDNISQLFAAPVQWKSIAITTDTKFDLDFDGVEIDNVKLKEIKVRRRYETKALSDAYTYDLVFEQISANENDRALSACLNAKEEDEDGKKQFIQYTVVLDEGSSNIDSSES